MLIVVKQGTDTSALWPFICNTWTLPILHLLLNKLVVLLLLLVYDLRILVIGKGMSQNGPD